MNIKNDDLPDFEEILSEHRAYENNDRAEDVSLDMENEQSDALSHVEDLSRNNILDVEEKILPGKKTRKKTRHIIIISLAGMMVAVLLAFFLIPGLGGRAMIRRMVNNTALMQKTRILKLDIKNLANDIKAQDVERAEETRRKMKQDVIDVREILSNPFWSTAGTLPLVRSEFDDAKTLLDIVDEADEEIIGPLLSLMGEYPLSEFRDEKGRINDAAIMDYLRYIERILPEAKDLCIRIKPLNLSRFDSSGSLKRLISGMDDVLALLEIAEDADEVIISRLLPIMEENPLSELKENSRLNEAAVVKYIRFCEEVLPEAQNLVDRTKAMDLSRIADKKTVAKISEELDDITILLDTAKETDKEIVVPVLQVVEKYPVSELSVNNSINVAAVSMYFELIEDILPKANKLSEQFKLQDLSSIDNKGSIAKFTEKLDKKLKFINEVNVHIPLFKGIIGDGSDKVYLLVAMCTSEMRSAGGFPAHMGTVSIRNGKLSIGEFDSVIRVLPNLVPESAGITPVERTLFLNINKTRDIVFCPDFERVSYIWSECYKEKYNEKLDGVIAVSPLVIQKLLSFLGSIELSDGTVMNGDNTVRVLGYEVYFNYYSKNSEYYYSKTADQSFREADEATDALFGEAAEKTLNLMMSGISLSSTQNYYSAFIQSMEDRSMQIWMADEDTQQLIRDEDWNSHLSTNMDEPEIGIYFNSAGGGNKNSWFLDIDTDLSEAIVNNDGTRSYTLKVIFSNAITEEESKTAGRYIKGIWSGINGYVYFSAPYGGTISNVKANGFNVLMSRYEDHDLCATWVKVLESRPYVISCTVTTPPGVETVPIVRLTPTMTEYR